MTALRQLAFDLPHAGSRGREDLITGRANARAIEFIDNWPDWPGPVALLAGPPGSGKSHVAAAWAQAAGATTVQASEIGRALPPRTANFLVEDAGPGAVDERALFHLLNHVRAERGHCLIVARTRPGEWGLALPDLISRLRAAPMVEISEPDDALLRAVIVKLFADRQVEPPPAVVDYMVARMERSLAAAGALVAAIDAEALARKCRVTRPLAAAVMAGLDVGPDPQSCFDFDTGRR